MKLAKEIDAALKDAATNRNRGIDDTPSSAQVIAVKLEPVVNLLDGARRCLAKADSGGALVAINAAVIVLDDIRPAV